MKRFILLISAVAMLAVMLVPASASASNYCGPPVQSLKQLISFYQSDAGKAMGKAVERYVRADSSYYGINDDQSFESWLGTLKVVKAPKSGAGSRITSNTYCPGGNSVANYDGRYNVAGLTMSDRCTTKSKTTKKKVKRHGKWYWRTTKTTTRSCRHVFKGYCRNVVKSKVFKIVTKKVRYKRIKKSPKKTKTNCTSGQMKDSSGNCVNQTITQDCKAGTIWNGQQCVAINNNCGNVNTGSGNTNQGGNCNNTCTGNNSCNTNNPPPPTCEEQGNCPPPPTANRPPTVLIQNMPAHVYVDDQVQVCALANDPDKDSLLVTWSAQRGTVSSPFQPDPSGSPQKWCTRYTAPNTTGDDTVSVTVSDGEFSDSDSGSFPVVADDF